MASYFAGEFANSWLLAKMKIWRRNQHMAVRFVASTFAGQGLDSIIFFTGAFAWEMGFSELVRLIICSWLAKTAVETLSLIWTVPLVNWLKRVENSDAVGGDLSLKPSL